MSYPNTQLFINGEWQDAADGRSTRVGRAVGDEDERLLAQADGRSPLAAGAVARP